ncbi:MAG TPA: hypothetical protein VN175_08205, partial [Rhizomicrobium sp.]|nr:hypothetical protein [Rhizomicrobium sp.]
AIHLIAYVVSIHSADAGWDLVRVMLAWQLIDFPVGLTAIVGFWARYSDWINRVFGENSVIAFLLFPMNIANGLLGTVWWFFIPRIVVMVRA